MIVYVMSILHGRFLLNFRLSRLPNRKYLHTRGLTIELLITQKVYKAWGFVIELIVTNLFIAMY